jgi:hypothetical protein
LGISRSLNAMFDFKMILKMRNIFVSFFFKSTSHRNGTTDFVFLGGEKSEGRGEAKLEGKESGTPSNPEALDAKG